VLRIKLNRTGYLPPKGSKMQTQKKIKALVLVVERVIILKLVAIKEKLLLPCLI